MIIWGSVSALNIVMTLLMLNPSPAQPFKWIMRGESAETSVVTTTPSFAFYHEIGSHWRGFDSGGADAGG